MEAGSSWERGQRLHLAGSVADVAVILGKAQEFPTDEILRVLRPAGKAIFPDRTVTKPFPQGIDDWTHPYHGPDNNPQSNDKVVVAPYLTQFLAEPRYAPLPQVCVSAPPVACSRPSATSRSRSGRSPC